MKRRIAIACALVALMFAAACKVKVAEIRSSPVEVIVDGGSGARDDTFYYLKTWSGVSPVEPPANSRTGGWSCADTMDTRPLYAKIAELSERVEALESRCSR